MNERYQRRFLNLQSALVAAFIFCGLTAGPIIAAAAPYITPQQVDGIALLPPPPETNSNEQLADLNLVRSVFNARTKAEEERANKDSGLAFSLFKPAIGPDFDLNQHPKTKKLMEKIRDEIGDIIDHPKDHFERKRPYQADPSLLVGHTVGGYSYPSGHSTRGTVYALVLAEIFPDRKEAVLAMGRQIGWDRVIIAKHYLTDVRAGRVLGQAIVRELMANPEFQNDLHEAEAEWIHPALSPAK